MWNKIHEFLRKETFKTRDFLPPSFGIGIAIGLIALILLISFIISGIVFAIVSIVKVAKKKKRARLETATAEKTKQRKNP